MNKTFKGLGKIMKTKLPDTRCERFADPLYEVMYESTKGHVCTRCGSTTCKVRKAQCQAFKVQ